ADIVGKQGLRYAVSVVGQYRDLGLKQATMGVIMGSRMSLQLPKGYTVGPKGMMLEMVDNLDRLTRGLMLALFILFLVLMVQMGSISNAIVVMMAAPLELVGAFGLLYIRGLSYSPPVLWGLTIATVVVMATSIYLVDKIEHERKQGKSRREAILIAGPIRLRPIFMTTGATAAAFLPPMVAPPAGMDRFMPIATGMVGAIATSTLLTLIVVPVIYDIFEDVKVFFRKLYSKETQTTEIA
ncbi:MAG: efflux RND transporter permease subunit, partial [Dehalococcoidia bacterium]